MSHPTHGNTAARALPARANLEHLKNEAKARLDALRAAEPGAQLSDAQFLLAREYGFASWRELKAEVDRRAGQAGPDPVGHWIRAPGQGGPRLALHIWTAPGGGLAALTDSPDIHYYDLPVDAVSADGERLSFTMSKPSISILYEGEWDEAAQTWRGALRLNGVDQPLDFARGAYPPEPVVEGLDGLWDGVIGEKDPARLTFRIKTDAHGTTARLDSPDRSGNDMPVMSLARTGRRVDIGMQSAAFTGELSEDGETLAAEFIRGESRTPVTLRRRAPGAPPPAPPLPPVEVPRDVLARYVGRYRYERAAAAPFSLRVEDGLLYREVEGQQRAALKALSPTQFFDQVMDGRWTVETGPDGGVTGLVLVQQGREFRAQRD